LKRITAVIGDDRVAIDDVMERRLESGSSQAFRRRVVSAGRIVLRGGGKNREKGEEENGV
jgi:hypothetical protein